MQNEAAYIVELFLVGYVMGVVLDIYNTVTGASKWLKWLRPTLDLAYWVGSAFIVYYVLFLTDNGRVRVYAFALLAVGYIVYRWTIRNTVIRSAFVIVRVVRTVLFGVYRLVYSVTVRPLLVLWHLVKAILQAFYRLLCAVESGVFRICEFWLNVLLVRWLLRFPYVQGFFARLRDVWEEMWIVTSNWLRRKWGRV